MPKTNWLKGLKLNIHSSGTRLALILLVLTQVPVAIKTSAEIFYMEKVGMRTRSFVTAVKECNN